MATTIWNPLDKNPNVGTYGVQAAGPATAAWSAVRGNQAQTRGYFEVTLRSTNASAQAVIGIADATMSLSGYPGKSGKSAGVQWVKTATPQPFASGLSVSQGFINMPTSVWGDVLMIYLDGGNAWFGRDGVWTSGDPLSGSAPNITGITGPMFPAVGLWDSVEVVELNCGGPFKYTPPGPAWDCAPDPSFALASEIHYSLRRSRPFIGDIFVNSGNNVGPAAFTFTPLYLPSIDPAAVGAKRAWFKGIDIITSGTTPEIEDLGIIFRAPGDPEVTCSVPWFASQAAFTVNAGQEGGIRQSASASVPVVNDTIEWAWFRSTTAQYPASASYGLNYWLDSWAK